MSKREKLEQKGYKTYENSEINVYWNPKVCQHATECVRGNSEVFDYQRRPWVDINAASPEEIAGIIDRCPSGALQYDLKKEDNIRIKFEEENNSSTAYDGDTMIGQCHFARLKERWVITLTEVDENYGGRGIAKKLVLKVIEAARREKVKILPSCPYAKKLIMSNPEEYEDIL